eukprot:59508_1
MSGGREIISIHIGQAGIQMGASLWEQYCKEHKIGLDGERNDKKYKRMEKIRKNADNEWEPVHKQPKITDNHYINNNNNDNRNGYSNMNKPRESNDITKKMEIKKAEEEQRKNGQINNKQEKDSSLFEEKQDLSELPKSLQARIQEASVFFDYNMANDTHCPRALIMDLEPNVIDDVKNSAFGTLFNPAFYVAGQEDAANNYARGHYTIGAEYIEQTLEIIRKQVERCEHLQGFLLNLAVGGGTGSGFGGLLCESLTSLYRKKK